ncbi:MGMT family protein [Ornithinimicrobium sp. F0845]|uniref:MGMT family protein n=1 Tax=Ornithinimicrobium sp. F0845 TaxID=2926412 RepID=UPI001FF3A022|nr:MGMT family protein [Ornithinimicrobium sp. F0845]MCK0111096.1 MGMT family protein [Ornithinimicrobium sp. F0845]
MHPDLADPAPLPAFAGRVIDLVDTIPSGRVLSYGDVAELLEYGGPRQVGQVMSRYGSSTNWWRVVRADGRLPECHQGEARVLHLAEGTPLTSRGVDMRRARWDGVSPS